MDMVGHLCSSGSLFIGRGDRGIGSPPRSVLFGSHQVWMLVHRKYTLVSGAHFVEGHQLPSTIPIWASEHHFNCREWQRILVATKMVPFYALLHRSSTGKVVVTQRRSKWRIQVILTDPPMRLSSCCDPLYYSLHPNLIIQLLSLQWNVLSAHSVGPNVSAPEKDPSKIVLSVSFSNRTTKYVSMFWDTSGDTLVIIHLIDGIKLHMKDPQRPLPGDH